MARPSEAHVEVARRFLARSCEGEGHSADPAVASRVYDALSGALTPIIGESGFRAIFARSVKLTAADYPVLKAVPTVFAPPPEVDTVLTHVLDCLAGLEPTAALELATSLYAAFYALLTKMIGESLVEEIVKGALPTIDESGSEVRD